MIRISAFIVFVFLAAIAPAVAQVQDYKPVTQQMLLDPSPNDWLMYSRTYDAWRYSPLKQINTKNVNQVRMAWVRGLGPGATETIPIVHDGILPEIRGIPRLLHVEQSASGDAVTVFAHLELIEGAQAMLERIGSECRIPEYSRGQ